ncbi:MAG: AraC family transcriptional regulator [Variovorax sp.]
MRSWAAHARPSMRATHPLEPARWACSCVRGGTCCWACRPTNWPSGTPLEALWGAGAGAALARIHDAGTPTAQLAVLEALLIARLTLRPQAMHPVVAQALLRLGSGPPIRELVDGSGYSHRHFVALFREAVGLPPKRLERVLRFQRAIGARTRFGNTPWADVAVHAGYSDQAHFNREFRDIAGMTPQAYARASPISPNHVRA